MKLAMIGLGRMGGSMTERLLKAGHAVVAYAPDAAAVAEAEKRGAIGAHSVEEVVRKLEPPRVVWLMIPVGPPVEETINALRPLLARGDIIVDGGTPASPTPCGAPASWRRPASGSSMRGPRAASGD
jgi:6-phosphogluconate dehydrogenase